MTKKEDKKKIDALDWIVNEKSQRVQLLQYANSTMRYFLLLKQNLDATKLVLAKVPNDSLNIILKQYNCKDPEELTDLIQNTIKEYLCFKEYIVTDSSCSNLVSYFFNYF